MWAYILHEVVPDAIDYVVILLVLRLHLPELEIKIREVWNRALTIF
jgi:hypothetical protein